jgi:hypothetical protein
VGPQGFGRAWRGSLGAQIRAPSFSSRGVAPLPGPALVTKNVNRWRRNCRKRRMRVDKLNKEINPSCRSRDQSEVGRLDSEPLAASPGDFGKFIADETEKWGKVIREAKINPD